MLKFTPRRTIKPPHSKKIPVQPSLYEDSHNKLYKLAISCNMTKTALAEKLINMAVNNPDVIEHFQELYNTEPGFRVVPVIDQEGRVTY
jgi:hypothetical protein